MIMLDSNIFMYAAGVAHPNKKTVFNYWKNRIRDIDAVIDAEVLQEILHRYRSIHRWEDGADVFCSYDEDFDNIPDLKRFKPDDIIAD